MDNLIPEIQEIIEHNVYTMIWTDVMEEMVQYMYKKINKENDILKERIFKMVENSPSL